jgi:hypothetical protein
MKVPLCGGTPTTLASQQHFPWAIAVTPTDVYSTDNHESEAHPSARVIPALVISVSGGLIVTRTGSSESRLAETFRKQVLGD